MHSFDICGNLYRTHPAALNFRTVDVCTFHQVLKSTGKYKDMEHIISV